MGAGIELKVAEALQNDVGRGLVRIDSRARKELDVTTGDIIELKGKRVTAAIVWQAHPQDEGLNIVRMDGYLRQNAGVALGDKIFVKKAELKEAKKVMLAPSQPMKYSPGFDQFVKKRLVGRALTRGDTIFVGVFGTSFPLTAAVVQPQGVVIVNEGTEVVLKTEPMKEAGRLPSISYEDIGGLKEETRKIREMVELPMRHPELFERLGIEPPKGVLIHGPPGCGKTLLAKAVASESEANFISIGGPELVSKFVGESEERLRQLFKDAEENAPTIIFMDEIDAIAPKREEVTGEVERRMVSQLLSLMDGLKARGNVIVIGATNRPNSIDPALRRPGRFDREIEIGVPDRNSRKEILQIHTRNMPIAEDVALDELANITHGYTGADLSSLCKEAAMRVLRRILPKIDLEQEFIPPKVLEDLRVMRADFFDAMREIQPSALREVFIEIPNVKWTDVGGLEDVKKELKEAVELPLKNPDVFKRMGIRPVKGILLVGLPGTGKTMLAKAVATESEANFISIKGPEVFSKYVGESEKTLRELFRKARIASPSIVLIDELDAIASARGGDEGGTKVGERIVNTLLTEMDGLTNLKNVVVIGATNRPDSLDQAILRAGRFDKIVEIPPPDEETREEIFKVHVKNMPLAKDVELKKLAKATEGFTGADIEGVCREAGMTAIRENENCKDVKAKHFEQAMKISRPSITKKHVESMKAFKERAETMYR
ncbi:CDC48 family AAA ATPase [Candidatus Micrarchaeota archaeon]|nr:CDC48 family AAA ATPase [Candidatus Micrarchaeota archaeon]